MVTTPLITNPPTSCIKETQTGIDRNLNIIPSDQLNTRSTSTTSSQSLLSPYPLPSLLSTTPTTTNMKGTSPNNFHPWNNIPLSKPDLKCSSKCEHPSQCIARQPRPPPFPSLTFLYNERSKYQQHMMKWSKEAFAGCDRCFSVDNENYGCDTCVWLKWWYKWHGDTHGFPDISTKTYQRYL
jgi:hypothetical protein